MYYLEEKKKKYLKREIRYLWDKTFTSKQRYIVYGGLAGLLWLVGLVNAPSIQKSRTIIPHLTLIVAAYSITSTVSRGVSKANSTQKELIKIYRKIKNAHQEDLDLLRKKVQQLEKQYF